MNNEADNIQTIFMQLRFRLEYMIMKLYPPPPQEQKLHMITTSKIARPLNNDQEGGTNVSAE
jgi:hypothetical protein